MHIKNSLNFKNILKIDLKKLKIKNISNLFVTSNLSKLKYPQLKKDLKLKLILESIKETMGKNYTIFTPTSTLNLVNTNEIFDIKKTKSFKMGPLSEYIRNQNSVRSLHPYWSISAIGKNKNLLNNVSPHAYGHGSPWTIMLNEDSTQLNIGIHPSKAVTLIHHIETIAGVPYRFTREFKHKVKVKGIIKIKNFYMTVFYKSIPIKKKIKLNEHYFKELSKRKKINYAKNKFGLEMWSFKMKDFLELATEMFKKDIYCYLEKKPNLEKVHKN
tara:strand:+ start:4225 stop:5040 length:816 start_codon:yes stop_codon:yes gene_type:complete